MLSAIIRAATRLRTYSRHKNLTIAALTMADMKM